MITYPVKTVNWLDVDFDYLLKCEYIGKSLYKKMKKKKYIYEVSYFHFNDDGSKDWEGGYWFESKKLRDDFYTKFAFQEEEE
mgnify:CR=1 FL=1